MLQQNAAEGIHRIDEAFVNWYLVEDGGRVTIVDTGLPRSWGTLERTLGELGRSLGDVDGVVLTHGHFDHMGFADRARRELGVPVHAHEDEVAVTSHPWRYDHERSRAPYFLKPGFLKVFASMGAHGALWVKGTDDVRTFRDGEELDVPGRPRVVGTPGHTHGHCSLHFTQRGAAIAGDAVVTRNPYGWEEGPRIVSGAATADSDKALRSLDALDATDAQTVLPGHGDPWTGGVREMTARAREVGPS